MINNANLKLDILRCVYFESKRVAGKKYKNRIRISKIASE
jgi:hypothetical protein